MKFFGKRRMMLRWRQRGPTRVRQGAKWPLSMHNMWGEWALSTFFGATGIKGHCYQKQEATGSSWHYYQQLEQNLLVLATKVCLRCASEGLYTVHCCWSLLPSKIWSAHSLQVLGCNCVTNLIYNINLGRWMPNFSKEDLEKRKETMFKKSPTSRVPGVHLMVSIVYTVCKSDLS